MIDLQGAGMSRIATRGHKWLRQECRKVWQAVAGVSDSQTKDREDYLKMLFTELDKGGTNWGMFFKTWRRITNSGRPSTSENISYPGNYPLLPYLLYCISFVALPSIPALYFYIVTSDRA
ncbi:hypothetical protein ATANTOWER_000438 [Ataeniobius toweri]|uniref:Uncharacterized protein n=1 Tax=Ataeniobius toweri TaxID=208326 RepID=A0ABU7BLS9_9TELE|nr:hypothetical protein [Ataeniobius toweri]